MMFARVALALAASAIVLLSCFGCEEERAPSRDQIPVIREVVFKIQEAVKAENLAAIDSLLSVKILDIDQSSDSLLTVAYGEDGMFSFAQFDLVSSSYVRDKARVNCVIVDSEGNRGMPIEFTLVFEHKKWLLKRFEVGSPESGVSEEN